MSDLLLYTTEDGRSQIRLRADQQTVWLTQLEMAELFDATKQNISLHLKNLYEDRELDPAATVKESLTVQTEGARQVQRKVVLYNLDAILAVGYRVRSPRGAQFRRWASTVLKEFLVKGFVLDDERLKNPDGRPDYFDEMLARIRDIRASEKRFYQKLRDLFALSIDYDKTDQATQTFFATVQNLLLYAVTQQTAAELIVARANGKLRSEERQVLVAMLLLDRLAAWRRSRATGPTLTHVVVVEEAQLHAIGDAREQRDVRPGAVERGPERVGTARPDLHTPDIPADARAYTSRDPTA